MINSVNISSSQQVQLNVRFVEINRQVGQELGTKIVRRLCLAATAASSSTPIRIVEPDAPPARSSASPLDGFSIDVAIKALEDRGVAVASPSPI